MENKTSRRIKLLFGAVLVVFLAITVLDILPSGAEGFREGVETGMRESSESIDGIDLPLAVHIERIGSGEPIKFPNGLVFRPLSSFGELTLLQPKGTGWIWIFVSKMGAALIALAAMVVFLVHLVKFAVGFPRRRIIDYRNIVSLRWIAISLGVSGALMYGFFLIDYLWVKSNVVLEGYRVVIDPPPSGIVVALILWAMTEILNLAGKLQNEQDLTI